jgi:hypothetical protein
MATKLSEKEIYVKEWQEQMMNKGIAEANYLVAFSKPLLELGFTNEQVVSLITTRLSTDLSEYLKDVELEIERIKNLSSEEESEDEI